MILSSLITVTLNFLIIWIAYEYIIHYQLISRVLSIMNQPQFTIINSLSIFTHHSSPIIDSYIMVKIDI